MPSCTSITYASVLLRTCKPGFELSRHMLLIRAAGASALPARLFIPEGSLKNPSAPACMRLCMLDLLLHVPTAACSDHVYPHLLKRKPTKHTLAREQLSPLFAALFAFFQGATAPIFGLHVLGMFTSLSLPVFHPGSSPQPASCGFGHCWEHYLGRSCPMVWEC
jgi:hypothetical protein